MGNVQTQEDDTNSEVVIASPAAPAEG